MNKTVIDMQGYKEVASDRVLEDLYKNNCSMPDVTQVIYNIGKKAYPQRDLKTGKAIKDKDGNILYAPAVSVLATTVFFEDDTKVTVVNSEHDGISFEDYTLSNGETIKVADKISKERGLIYAIMKRLVSRPNAEGKMVDSGLGRILNEVIEQSYDTLVAEHERKIKKAKAKAVAEEAKKNAKPKVKRHSIVETLARLNDIMDRYENKSECHYGQM